MWQSAYLSLVGKQSLQEARLTAAAAACRQCDSAALPQPVLCECVECPVLYARLGSAARLQGVEQSLCRMDIF
jgi:hypothetical protein